MKEMKFFGIEKNDFYWGIRIKIFSKIFTFGIVDWEILKTLYHAHDHSADSLSEHQHNKYHHHLEEEKKL